MIRVVQNEEEPIPVDIIASAIVGISHSMKKIAESRLNEKALDLLISKDSGVPLYQVRLVRESLNSLEKTYCKPKARGGKS